MRRTIGLLGALLVAASYRGARASPPAPPAAPSPPDGAAAVAAGTPLCVDVSDPDGDTLDVTFLVREVVPPGGDFTVVALPDTQFMAESCPDLLLAQAEWIVANRDALGIVYVASLGDMTDRGDMAGHEAAWRNVHEAFSRLEAATSAAWPDGIPFGATVGNHDNSFQARLGEDEGATTVQYTRYFGLTRACGGTCDNAPGRACRTPADCDAPGSCVNPSDACKSYFGGRFDFGNPAAYPANTDNHYTLFSAAGLDFIAVHLEYDAVPGLGLHATLDWMEDLLRNRHPERRAIVVSHWIVSPYTEPPSWSPQGEAIWDRVKSLPNVFMMLCGHIEQAARRADPADDGHIVHTLLSDYQYRPFGGRGWMRTMTFSPQNGTIRVRTITPWVNYPETPRKEASIVGHPDDTKGGDASEFSLAYDMARAGSFSLAGVVKGAASGSRTCLSPPALGPHREYDWVVKVSDGKDMRAGPGWSFATGCVDPAGCDDSDMCTDDLCQEGSCVHARVPGCCHVDADCDDLDTCTSDACVAGACAAAPIQGCCRSDADCDDSDPCTADACRSSNRAALDLDGAGAFADAGFGMALNDHGIGGFTVEGWFLSRSAPATHQGLLFQGRQGGASLVAVEVVPGEPHPGLTVSVRASSALLAPVATAPVPFSPGEWHHFAAVVERPGAPSGQRLVLYLDGERADEADGVAWGAGPIRSSHSTLLGAARAATGAPHQFFDGMLDEVRVWGVSRTQAQVRADMRRAVASAEGLVARWGFEEGSGTVAADSAGANQAILAGATFAMSPPLPEVGPDLCASEPVVDWPCVPEPVPDSLPEPAPESITDPLPEPGPEPDAAAESVPENRDETVPESAPEPDTATELAPEPLPDPTHDQSMEPASEVAADTPPDPAPESGATAEDVPAADPVPEQPPEHAPAVDAAIETAPAADSVSSPDADVGQQDDAQRPRQGGGCATGAAGGGLIVPALLALSALLRRRRRAAALAALLSGLAGCAGTRPLSGPWQEVTRYPGEEWVESTPEDQGMDSGSLASAVDAILDEGLPVHGLLVARNGAIVLDVAFHPSGLADRHDVASVTKSVTATLVGIAVGRGDLPGLDAPVIDFFPEVRRAGLDPAKLSMTLRDLITMRSGLDCLRDGSDMPALLGMLASRDWSRYVLDLPMADAPGTRFSYCSPASHLLAVVLRRATGVSALEYARRHLFDPIGVRSADWPVDPATGDPHGWGDLALTRRDMARLGHLYLARGRWNGRQVVPEDFVKAALTPRVRLSGHGELDGYGYHWWTSSRGLAGAIGRGDQWVLVAPPIGLVVVLTGSGSGAASARKAEILERFVLAAVRGPGPLPPSPDGAARLASAVARAGRSRDPTRGPLPALPPAARDVDGVAWDIAANPYGFRSAVLGFSAVNATAGDPAVATLKVEQDGSPPLTIRIGLDGAWRVFPGRRGYPARARGAWEDESTFRVDLDELSLINRWTLRMTFRGDRMTGRLEEASGNPPATFEATRHSLVPPTPRRDGDPGP